MPLALLRSFRAPLLAGICLLALAMPGTAQTPEPPASICPPEAEGCVDPDLLRRLVLDIGFGREDFRLPGDQARWADGRLRRFRRGILPVEVYSDDPDFAEDAAFWGPFQDIAARLPALTGLRLTPRARIRLWDGPPGLMIFVGKREWLRESLVGLAALAGADPELAGARFDKISVPYLARGRAICFAEVRERDDDVAELALSIVVLETSPELPGCVYEEMLQALGPINDSVAVKPTLFNDAATEVTAPTDYDWLAFSILYDPRLKTGMTEAEAAPIIDRILAEMAD